MKINHIAVYVQNLEESKEFFCKYFGGTAGNMYHNTVTGFKSYFIAFEGGARLEIMTRSEVENNKSAGFRTGYAHIAFGTGSRENVTALTERLRADGYIISSEPRTTGDGYFESVVRDSEGNEIEITV